MPPPTPLSPFDDKEGLATGSGGGGGIVAVIIVIVLLGLIAVFFIGLWLWARTRYPGKVGLWFDHRFSHSNPTVQWRYLPTERREEIRDELAKAYKEGVAQRSDSVTLIIDENSTPIMHNEYSTPRPTTAASLAAASSSASQLAPAQDPDASVGSPARDESTARAPAAQDVVLLPPEVQVKVVERGAETPQGPSTRSSQEARAEESAAAAAAAQEELKKRLVKGSSAAGKYRI